jgi:L-lactate dehydrogenase complex protein LldG
MDESEKILARIREALTVLAPPPGHGAHSAVAGPPASHAREWLPRVGNTLEEQLQLFQKTATDLKAEFFLLKDQAECARQLQELCRREGWTKIATHAGELTDALAPSLGLPVCRTDHGYDVAQLESSSAGITQCDALVAQTGSVLVTSRSAGGRALSVLPPHHVVLARREQMLADLPAAFALLKQRYGAQYPSFISFITGPSRTGDIERILVLGAHGPKKLSILCF